MTRWHALLAAVVSVLAMRSLEAGEAPADLVLREGKIVTMDLRHAVVQALAARGDKIVAVGTNEQMARLIGDKTRVIDLGGQLAIPGFIEGHGHFVGLGRSKMMLARRRPDIRCY
jgi:predicted amidohydrolase YtcJ